MKRLYLIEECPLIVHGFIEYNDQDHDRVELSIRYIHAKYKSISEIWIREYSTIEKHRLDTITQLLSRYTGVHGLLLHLDTSNIKYTYYPINESELYFVLK